MPPLRNEIKHLNFTVQRKRDGDYIWLDTDGEILLDLNLEKKRHQPIAFSITKDAPELANIIKDSYNLYPREYVFTPKNIYPNLNKKASQASLDARLNALFAFTGKRVSVNSLRSSYVSYMVHQAMVKGKLLSVKEKNKIAEKMRSSRKYFDESYTKRFQINPQPQAHPIKQEDNNIVYSSILYESNVPLSTKYQANLLASKFILAKQYPPVSLTSDSTLFSAQAYGNGTNNRIVCRAGTPPFASKCKSKQRTKQQN
jgi:hypothetical protein